jgi:hypothetical protein
MSRLFQTVCFWAITLTFLHLINHFPNGDKIHGAVSFSGECQRRVFKVANLIMENTSEKEGWWYVSGTYHQHCGWLESTRVLLFSTSQLRLLVTPETPALSIVCLALAPGFHIYKSSTDHSNVLDLWKYTCAPRKYMIIYHCHLPSASSISRYLGEPESSCQLIRTRSDTI